MSNLLSSEEIVSNFIELYNRVNNNIYYSSSYDTLALALTYANNKTLVIDSSINITSNTTIPYTVSIVVIKGGMFNISENVTLTISGSFQCGMYQCFNYENKTDFFDIDYSDNLPYYTYKSSTNKVKLNLGVSLSQVYSEWWGAKSDGTEPENTTYAMQATINCIIFSNFQQDYRLVNGVWILVDVKSFGGKLKLCTGTYSNTQSLILSYNSSTSTGINLTIEGCGYGTVIQRYGNNDSPLIYGKGMTYEGDRLADITIRNLKIHGSDKSCYGIFLSYIYRFLIEEVYCFKNLYAGIYILGASDSQIINCTCSCGSRLEPSSVNMNKLQDISYGILLEGGKDYYYNKQLYSFNKLCIVEQVVVKGCGLVYNEVGIYMNHDSDIKIYDNVINSFTFKGIMILTQCHNYANNSVHSFPTFCINIFNNYMEPVIYDAIYIDALDRFPIKHVNIFNNTFNTMRVNTLDIITIGSTDTKKFIDNVHIYDNFIGYYTDDGRSPHLISVECDTELAQNIKLSGHIISPYGGRRYGYNTIFEDFTKNLNITIDEVLSNSLEKTSGIDKVLTASDTFLLKPTMKLSKNGSNDTKLWYVIDTSEHRYKTLMISFFVKSNVSGQFIRLFADYHDEYYLDLCAYDNLWTHTATNSTISVDEASNPKFRRIIFFLPIHNGMVGESIVFNTNSLTSKLALNFIKKFNSESEYIYISDLQVMLSEDYYHNTTYNNF